MNKKRYTVKWIALLMQAVCLFFVFSGASYAAPPPTPPQTTTPACKPPGDQPATKRYKKKCQACQNQCSNEPSGGKKWPNFSKAVCLQRCTNPNSCVYNYYAHPNLFLGCFSVNMNQGQGIVRYMLIPLQFLITYVAYIMAFFFLAWGLYRLRHAHEGGGANRQASGVGSALCFFAAALLFQYQYAVKLVGTSFLGLPTINSTDGGKWNYGGTKTLPMDPKNLFGYFNLKTCQDQQKNGPDATANACTQLAGSEGVDNDKIGILTTGSSNANNWKNGGNGEYSTLETLFATLMIIGFISFVRGAMLIVKAGEGTMQAGESTGTKAVTHILAGGLLCNANHVASVINNMVNQVHGPT